VSPCEHFDRLLVFADVMDCNRVLIQAEQEVFVVVECLNLSVADFQHIVYAGIGQVKHTDPAALEAHSQPLSACIELQTGRYVIRAFEF